jgi:benzoyl-CoA reductase/2-hydroxyglutaryl-CoA dehydratase subunit BcrC/BadD/HgdB
MIGTFCIYVPEELILAVGATYVGLRAGDEIGVDEAEGVLPPNTYTLTKSFMGFKFAGFCPHIQISDPLVRGTTCNGKKKAYEILNDYKQTYVGNPPDEDRKGPDSLEGGGIILQQA